MALVNQSNLTNNPRSFNRWKGAQHGEKATYRARRRGDVRGWPGHWPSVRLGTRPDPLRARLLGELIALENDDLEVRKRRLPEIVFERVQLQHLAVEQDRR